MIGAAFCCGAYDWDAEIPIVPEIGTTIDWEPEAEEEDEEDEEDDDDDDPAIATVWLTAGLTVLLEIGTATGRTVSDYLFIIVAVAPLAKAAADDPDDPDVDDPNPIIWASPKSDATHNPFF